MKVLEGKLHFVLVDQEVFVGFEGLEGVVHDGADEAEEEHVHEENLKSVLGPYYCLDAVAAFFGLLVGTNAILQIWCFESAEKRGHEGCVSVISLTVVWHVDHAEDLLEDGEGIQPHEEQDEKWESVSDALPAE